MNEETLFHEARQKSAGERTAFLDEACGGDLALRQRIETLLQADDNPDSLLELKPAAPSAMSSLGEVPGQVIGPYKLLEQIGEGGMGVVFMAEQQEPVRRKVALKLIKPGMDTRQVIARFEAERQALAVMDHPSIARVLDAGATENGRPYFVMELVRGVPITTFCDENHVPVRERLELFASVCQAIQHAHTKGIIHRDIKPTNVLVTRQDGRPVVKVIDFGVAKAMGQQLTEKTLFTNFAQMVGTPLYMSPEQAEQSGVDIDTRSDIFSLGVLLYELLTGSTPVNEEQMKKAAFDEVRRIIREDEPPTPSARISGSHTLPAIAARRQIEPARLSRLVRGELDWIVMKSLEKDRGRRYETANAFAVDLLRYLNDEAVLACPPSAKYRFGKFARRNRVAIATGTLVALALVLGTIVSTWQAIRAETARAAEAQQRKVAEAERNEAEKQREQADANFQQARKAVDEYFTLVSESTLLDVPGLQPLRKKLLEAALRFYEKAALERTNDPGVLADVALTFLRVAQIDILIGRNDDAIAAMASALDVVDRLRRDYPGAKEHYRRLAGYWKGYRPAQSRSEMPKDPQAAFETVQRAIETWQKLADENPEQPAFRSDLASMCSLMGAALASVNERESLRYYEMSKGILEKLVVDQPDVPEYRADLARNCQEMVGKLVRAGRLTESEAAQSRSLSLQEELVATFPKSPHNRVELARILSQRAGVIVKQQPAEAEKMFHRAAELCLSLVLEFPEVTIYGETLAANLSDWGKAAHSGGKKDQIERFNSEATELVQKVIETLEARTRDRPKDQRAREQLARFCYRVAEQLTLQGILTDLAGPLHRRATALTEALVVEFPDDRHFVERVAAFHRSAAGPLWSSGRTDEAAEHYHAAVALLEKRASNDPAQAGDTRLFAEMAVHLARIMAYGARTTDDQETSRLCLRATEIVDSRIKENPVWRAYLAVAVRAYGQRLLKEPERLAEAAQMIRWSTPIVEVTIKDIALLDKRTADHTAYLDDRHLAAETQKWLAKILTWTSRPARAEEMWLRAIHSYKSIANDHSAQELHVQNALQEYQQYLGVRVEQLENNGQRDGAEAILQRAIKSSEAILAERPKDRQARQQLAWALGKAANRWLSPADRDMREQFLRRALALHTELANQPPGDPEHFEQTGHLFRYLGWFERDRGRLDEARQNFEKAVEVFKMLAPDVIPQRNGFYRDFEADTHLELAYLLAAGGKSEAAEKAARQAADIYETLAGQFPDRPDYHKKAADAQRVLADRLEADGRHEESEKIFRRVITGYEKLAADFPDNREYRTSISRSYANLIEILLVQDKHAQAEETIRQAIGEFDKLAAAHPAVPDYHRSRAAFQRQLAQRQASDKRSEEAEKTYQEAIDSYETIIAEFPQYEDLWQVYSGLAQSMAASDRPREADEARRKMVELAPRNAGTLNNLAWGFATSADPHARNASLAVELAKKGVELDPKDVRLPNTLGVAHYRSGNWQDAIEWLTKSIDLRTGGDSFDWFFLAMAYWQLDNKNDARKWHAKAVEWMDANKPHDQQLLRFRTEAKELIKAETPVTDQEPGVKAEGKSSP